MKEPSKETSRERDFHMNLERAQLRGTFAEIASLLIPLREMKTAGSNLLENQRLKIQKTSNIVYIIYIFNLGSLGESQSYVELSSITSKDRKF